MIHLRTDVYPNTKIVESVLYQERGPSIERWYLRVCPNVGSSNIVMYIASGSIPITLLDIQQHICTPDHCYVLSRLSMLLQVVRERRFRDPLLYDGIDCLHKEIRPDWHFQFVKGIL